MNKEISSSWSKDSVLLGCHLAQIHLQIQCNPNQNKHFLVETDMLILKFKQKYKVPQNSEKVTNLEDVYHLNFKTHY